MPHIIMKRTTRKMRIGVSAKYLEDYNAYFLCSNVATKICCILLTKTEEKTDVSCATFKLAGSAEGRLL